jgi:UDP-N-acetylglucosamine transferase subunit ALG13
MSTLFVATAGGHLAELVKLGPRLHTDGDPVWVTFETEQSRTLLEGERVIYVRYTEPRDYLNVARNVAAAQRILSEVRPSRVVSTGSGIALSFLPLARARGIEAHYIESAARPTGPSLTGRLLQRVPGVDLYTQFQAWAGDDWRFAGSVLDEYEPAEPAPLPDRPLRLVLTLGTIKFPFTRLVSRLTQVLSPDVEVLLWQVGGAPSMNGRFPVAFQVEPVVLRQALQEADVIVCHGGVGSVLDALDTGRCPIVVPRRHRFGEHVDDHQVALAHELESRGLAMARECDALSAGDIADAARRSVQAVRRAPEFELV